MKEASVTHLMNAFGHAFGFTPGSNLSLNTEKLLSKMFIQGRATLLTWHIPGKAMISLSLLLLCGPSWWLSGKEYTLPVQETQVWSLGWENPLEKEMAIYSSILALKIPRTEEPGWLQSLWSPELDTTW